jgi:hypothetical protein
MGLLKTYVARSIPYYLSIFAIALLSMILTPTSIFAKAQTNLNDGSKSGTTIIVAIITLAGVLINIILTIISNDRSRYIETITTSRIKWGDELRDKMSEFISSVNNMVDMIKKDFLYDDISDTLLLAKRHVDKHRSFVNLLLNPNDDRDREISTLVDLIVEKLQIENFKDDGPNFENLSSEISSKTKDLSERTQKYLKENWETVKKESKSTVDMIKEWLKQQGEYDSQADAPA